MKKRQVLSIFCALAMLTGVLSGCGEAETSSSDSTNSTASSSVEGDSSKIEETADKWTPDPQKKYKISTIGYMLQPLDDDPVIKKMIEEKFNVELDMWYIDESKWDELFSVRLAGGEIPDFIRVKRPDQLATYVDQGILMELPDDLVQNHLGGIYDAMESYSKGCMDYGKIDGKMYGLPALSATNALHIPLVYRQDWLDKLGLSVPTTLDEFVDVMYAFANDDPDGNGKKDTYGLSQDGMQAIYGAYGIVIDNSGDMYFGEKDGKIYDYNTSPEFKEALTLLSQMYTDGVLDPEFITGENSGGYWALSHAFVKNRIGFSCRGNYYHWTPAGAYDLKDDAGNAVPCEPGAMAQELAVANPEAKTVYGSPLKNEDGTGGIKMFNRLQGYYSFGKLAEEDPGKVGKMCEILEYQELEATPEEKMTFGKGIKGEHWDWLDEEREIIKELPPYNDPASNFDPSSLGCNPFGFHIPGDLTGYQETWAADVLNYDEDGIESAVQVSIPVISEKKGELMKLRDEMVISIITGEKPIDYFDEYVEKYNSIGGKEVIEAANEWYTANHS
ncbi:MAG: ABC transporter substrate-binding protein [Candidatus Merdivicinus sp.]|jgi:putative aldouronate transport system substrate-binding protein